MAEAFISRNSIFDYLFDRSICPATAAIVPRISSRRHHFEICGRQDDSWEQVRVGYDDDVKAAVIANWNRFINTRWSYDGVNNL
jgi:hypothetical protein